MVSRAPVFCSLWLACLTPDLSGAGPRVETLQIALDQADLLRVVSFAGDVSVETDTLPEARLKMKVAAVNSASPGAGAHIERVKASVERNAREVTVTVRLHERAPMISTEPWPPVSVQLEILVPEHCALEVVTASGDVRLGELSAPARITTTEGTLFCRRAGSRLEAHCEIGDVVVSRAMGDVDLRTKAGVIRVGSVAGRAWLDNRSGDIEILAAHGGLRAHAVAGDLSVGLPRSPAGRFDLETSGGGIVLGLDPASSIQLEASSVWGKVSSKLPWRPVKGKLDSRKFFGILNAGEVPVVAKADGGHVLIEARPELLPPPVVR